MRIDRILNNNVVIIKDENGEEQVVCGKGIAYKKKAGDLLSEKLINKVFVLKDTAQKQHFQEIISEIPMEYIQITTEIVEMLTQTLERKLNDTKVKYGEKEVTLNRLKLAKRDGVGTKQRK